MTTIKTTSGVLLLLLFSCNSPKDNTPAAVADEPLYKALIVQKNEQPDSSWGYIIFYKKHQLIKQFTVPVIEGSRPFLNRQQALITGNLVAAKLNRNQNPRITKRDLDSLGITSLTYASEKN